LSPALPVLNSSTILAFGAASERLVVAAAPKAEADLKSPLNNDFKAEVYH
jgi:hypothetical protein